jgi:serine/threonine protein phosphatase PrpC/CRP-like cAMP-binding protein
MSCDPLRVAGRASIVGAAETNVGRVRDHNEDAYFFDSDLGVFLVCDGMGGHAAGEVASAIAVKTIRSKWTSDETLAAADKWLESGAPAAKKEMMASLRSGVLAAHTAIISEGIRDEAKSGMGTTLVGGIIVGGDAVFAHAGDSRAYLVRDGIAMQLTEDHTLLARLLAAGIDVDTSGEGARFRSMLTNALGIGQDCRVSTFVVPLADGDRFLLCSDGVSEYVKEVEVGEVLSKQPSPARAAQKLVDLALERGGADNATALVIRVLEAGETPLPADQRRRDDAAIQACPLWGTKVTPQQRLRALRIAIPRDIPDGERLAAHSMGERVAWIIVEGAVSQDGTVRGPGSLVYPESLIADSAAPDRAEIAVAMGEVRALALRFDDFREICDEDSELAEAVLEGLAAVIAAKRPKKKPQAVIVDTEADGRAVTDEASDYTERVSSRPTQSHHRPPTEPEIEAYIELEAEDPPERRPSESDHDTVVVTTVEDGAARLVERTEDGSSKVVSLAELQPVLEIVAEEPSYDDDEVEYELSYEDDKAITEDAPVAASTVRAPSGPVQPTRAKRVSDGWDDD